MKVPLDSVISLIKTKMGMAPDSVGAETIERAIKLRMDELGIEDAVDYYDFLSISGSEQQALFNEVSVPETWFFRDREPFKVLATHVKKLKNSGRREPIKILSVPCSTGEEPYSIAMVMRDAGFDLADFSVDAVDINTDVLEKARLGVYGSNSFRGSEMAFRGKYFQQQGKHYAIASEIKSVVRFVNKNILADCFMTGEGPYDVVFCRNLLIYFDYETKCKALKTLHRLMADSALLFLGHAETGRMPHDLFESLNLPGSFAYRKIDGAGARSVSPVSGRHSSQKQKDYFANTATPKVSPTRPVHQKPRKDVAPKKIEAKEIGAWVESIQAMADGGELKQAITECDKLIAAVPDAAEGYYLKGVVLLAFDADQEAFEAFKKAVYLDPQHYQSLVHLSVLAEERGDQRAAANYRARADRLTTNGPAVAE